MRSVQHLASLLALLGIVASESLPYNPTRILASTNSNWTYIFQPSPQSPGQAQLVSLDSAKRLASGQDAFTVLSQKLPFLQDVESLPYTPVIDADGNITVTTGNCSQGAGGMQIWRFAPDQKSSVGNGTWEQYQTSEQELGSGSAAAGSNYLASGVAFSEYVDSNETDTDLFIFGGMCPFANSTADTWTSSAEYSNLMLTLSPSDADTDYTDYNISVVTSRGPPIAEAGFSITPLSPTFDTTSASEAQKQQQDFILLGGHTQTAFINMSQVAVFSLPQESWSFLPVTQPSDAKTDLAARQTATQVEPRSGHTAVLTEDGNSVVLFGGWVGNVDTPAQPQLAVLNFGSGYGGDGGWSWSIPTAQTGSGLAPGTGTYGHGAVMLSGGVMMVVGGYSVSASSSKTIRRGGQTVNDQVYFYNVSSSAWVDSYTPPVTAGQSDDEDTGPLGRKSQQAGLGAGLSIGAAMLVSLVVFYFWYSRRLRRAREARGRSLLDRSSAGSSYAGQVDPPMTNEGGIDGRGGDTAAVGRFWNVWDQDNGSYPPREPQMQQAGAAAGATGLFVNIPSPTRGLRKGAAGRNYQYHAAPRYDDKRISHGGSGIHPIAEQEDEDDSRPATATAASDHRNLTDAERKLMELERVLNSPDPFLEAEPNPLGSHPVSPELGDGETIRRIPTGPTGASRAPVRSRPKTMVEPDVPNWTAESGPAEPLLHIDTGRVSPSKTDERTSSTLSERSNASVGSITRTMSTRTGAILAAAMAARAASNSSPEQSSSSDDRTHTMSTNGGRKSPYYYQTRARSSTNGSAQVGAPNSGSTDADSFTTARTNFAHLQGEGEVLLGGRPTLDRDDPYQRALAAHASTRASKPPMSYDENGPPPGLPPRRRQGWMGSLRRALNVVSIGERSFSLTGTSEQYTDDGRTSSTSPTKERRRQAGGVPRRAASDGGALLRQKRGRQDWEENHFPRYRDDPDPGDWGEPGRSSLEKQQAEEDWDVEDAAGKRDVQVMFTVPKSRLRVVNADMDRASLRSASDGALSRTDSVKNLRREGSIMTIRTRSEGDKVALASTAEEEKCEIGEGSAAQEQLLDLNEKEKAA